MKNMENDDSRVRNRTVMEVAYVTPDPVITFMTNIRAASMVPPFKDAAQRRIDLAAATIGICSMKMMLRTYRFVNNSAVTKITIIMMNLDLGSKL